MSIQKQISSGRLAYKCQDLYIARCSTSNLYDRRTKTNQARMHQQQTNIEFEIF
jgi:hypothetical protein